MNLITLIMDAVFFGVVSAMMALAPTPPAWVAGAFGLLGTLMDTLAGIVPADVWFPPLVAAVSWKISLTVAKVGRLVLVWLRLIPAT
jgi:hypothetical protein